MNNLINYLYRRFSQPSSWVAILAVASSMISTGGAVTPEMIGGILTALGLFHADLPLKTATTKE